MSAENPYQAPSANLSNAPVAEGELASRGNRLLASIIDTLLQMLVLFPLLFLFGVIDSFATMATMGFGMNLLILVMGVGVYLLLHGHLLNKNGQTIGKKLMGIRIVDFNDGSHPGLQNILLKRQLPWFAISVIPVLGSILSLINVLLIFREDHRCLHDLMAGTKVIVAR